ncbi:MAG: J domain-containing protein [Treponema sp.]|nr:J domain-containing protein [Treponema sp.]
MIDCYKILGVKPTATKSEIKRAYRLKAKIFHPDITANESEKFKQLVQAYEILSDANQRLVFDISYATQNHHEAKKKHKSTFDYRKWLSERTDEESRCKLLIWDLMHHREDDAVKAFKEMNMSIPGFSLSKWFSREDFMDYGFILSEELVFRGEYYDAAILLEQIILMEHRFEYFRHFFPEVIKFAKELFRRNIAGNVPDELALDAWERAFDLSFSKTDDAFFLIKMAEVYDRMGDERSVILCMNEALKLDAKVFIPKRLRSKI